MPKHLDAAYATFARCTSLHCFIGGRDALYDLQMVPVETSWGLRYSVFAQHGRRGSKLTPFNPCNGVDFLIATSKYDSILNEKQRKKGYVPAPLARESLACQELIDAATRACSAAVIKAPAALSLPEPPALPEWPGFEDFVTEAAAHLNAKWGGSGGGHYNCAVALADLAFSASEGMGDAIAQVKGCSTITELDSALSPEIRHWYPPGKRLPALRTLHESAAAL